MIGALLLRQPDPKCPTPLNIPRDTFENIVLTYFNPNELQDARLVCRYWNNRAIVVANSRQFFLLHSFIATIAEQLPPQYPAVKQQLIDLISGVPAFNFPNLLYVKLSLETIREMVLQILKQLTYEILIPLGGSLKGQPLPVGFESFFYAVDLYKQIDNKLPQLQLNFQIEYQLIDIAVDLSTQGHVRKAVELTKTLDSRESTLRKLSEECVKNKKYKRATDVACEITDKFCRNQALRKLLWTYTDADPKNLIKGLELIPLFSNNRSDLQHAFHLLIREGLNQSHIPHIDKLIGTEIYLLYDLVIELDKANKNDLGITIINSITLSDEVRQLFLLFLTKQPSTAYLKFYNELQKDTLKSLTADMLLNQLVKEGKATTNDVQPSIDILIDNLETLLPQFAYLERRVRRIVTSILFIELIKRNNIDKAIHTVQESKVLSHIEWDIYMRYVNGKEYEKARVFIRQMPPTEKLPLPNDVKWIILGHLYH